MANWKPAVLWELKDEQKVKIKGRIAKACYAGGKWYFLKPNAPTSHGAPLHDSDVIATDKDTITSQFLQEATI